MPKFSFPLPGRSKKQAPPPPPTQPMTKAHKILGSTYISIDSAKSWDDISNSGLSVSVSESTVPTSTSSNRAGRAGFDGPARKVNHEHRDWENDSDVVPRHIRINEPMNDSDGDDSDISRALREQPSTSTIKSWYDKTKQPLSVTQQTSASAMAKGLPPKAQKLLDVENTHPAPKARKKPSKLDLSRLKIDHFSGKSRDSMSMLGNDHIHRSPSDMSTTPLTPSSTKYRQKFTKRSTKENLRRQQQAEAVPPLPSPAGERVSPRQAPNMSELPSLYKHYEQMSFAQVVVRPEDESHPEEAAMKGEPLSELPGDMPPVKGVPARRESAYGQQPWPPSGRDDILPSALNSNPTQQTQTLLPQVIQVGISDKVEQLSPTDCGASISSRHTRTSKASKHTEKSFQTADFIDKSILMLSSDSEDDDEGNNYTELSAPAKKAAGSPSAYHPLASKLDASDGAGHPQGSGTDDCSIRQSCQTVRRASAAPAGFLTIPSRFSTTSSVTSPTTDSRASTQSSIMFQASPTLSLTSNTSGSSGHTATSNQGPLHAIEEARAVQTSSPQAPAVGPRKMENCDDSDLEYAEPASVVRRSPSPSCSFKDASVTRTGITECATRSQSTSSARSPSMESNKDEQSLEESGSSHEHVMGLTRQEQMLITALRQRRESMRKNGSPRTDSRSRKGHNSKESEATITEESFDLNFPVPPKAGTGLRKSSSVASSMIGLPVSGSKHGTDGSNELITADGTVFLLSPPPPHHHPQKPAPKRMSRRDARQSEHEQMLLYLDHPGGPALAIREGIMSPDTPSFTNTGSASGWPGGSVSPPSLRRQRSNIETSVKPARDHAMLRKQHDSAPIIDEEILESVPPFPPPNRALPTPPQSKTSNSDAGIPRPDSPISAMANVFPDVPQRRRTINTQMARLSAFGPPRALEAGWWGDED